MKKSSIDEAYPHIAEWVLTHGWVEVGQQYDPANFIMALDEGGVIWEGKKNYKSLDEAFQALDDALAKWMKENW